MKKVNRKSILIAIAIILLALTSIFGILNLKTANADSIESQEHLVFTEITDSDGNASYKVGISNAYRVEAEFVVIPETYNNLPVTEIALNGFSNCINLKQVVLPKSIKVIGNNGFTNCRLLERISLPCVEKIGINAFAMCVSLKNLYIPTSVEAVGANMLRNNSNTLYLQGTIAENTQTWDSSWANYFTGEVIQGADIGETINYRPILNDNNEIYGVEIAEYQYLYEPNTDLIVYNSILYNGKYLPVYNICPEAFTQSLVKSLTIRDRHQDDPNAPIYTHKINLRSNAFIDAYIDEINIEVGITLNHPKGLKLEYDLSMADFETIEGDDSGKSIKVFSSVLLKRITLPNDLEGLTDKMFLNCVQLEQIKIYGEENNGESHLGNINSIGNFVFADCYKLNNLFIPSNLENMGKNNFANWGKKNEQNIYVDFYDDEFGKAIIDESGERYEDWRINFSGLPANVVVHYKQKVEIQIDWQNDKDNPTITNIFVKPDRLLPEIDLVEYYGYDFKGIYTEPDGKGNQYYTDKLKGIVWNEGDSETLYAYYTAHISQVTINGIVYPIAYGAPMPAVTMPDISLGFSFEGYFIGEDKYYNGDLTSAVQCWDRVDDEITMTPKFFEEQYSINYVLSDYKGQPNNNPLYYKASDEIVFEKLSSYGYKFEWIPAKIEKGTTGDIIVYGTWTEIITNINYELNGGKIDEDNPMTVCRNQSLKLNDPKRVGYNFIGWYVGDQKITAVTYQALEEITVTARWESKLNQPNVVTYVANGDRQYRATSSYLIVIMSASNFRFNFELVITSSVKQVLIYAEEYMVCNNFYITIENRSSDLIMKMENFGMCAPTGQIAISMSTASTAELQLYTYGKVEIYGADGAPGRIDSYAGGDGTCAIYCNYLCIATAENLIIKGGDYGKGYYSAYDGVAASAIVVEKQLRMCQSGYTITAGSNYNTMPWAIKINSGKDIIYI